MGMELFGFREGPSSCIFSQEGLALGDGRGEKVLGG